VTYLFSTYCQGFTFPVAELFLEDVLEKSRYNIKSSDSGNYQGSSRGRRRESESKKDDLTTLFEVCYATLVTCKSRELVS